MGKFRNTVAIKRKKMTNAQKILAKKCENCCLNDIRDAFFSENEPDLEISLIVK